MGWYWLYIVGILIIVGQALTSIKSLSSYILIKSSLNWFENKPEGELRNQAVTILKIVAAFLFRSNFEADKFRLDMSVNADFIQ